jgi:hypothetical protein
MEKSKKPSSSVCYTPSSEPFRTNISLLFFIFERGSFISDSILTTYRYVKLYSVNETKFTVRNIAAAADCYCRLNRRFVRIIKTSVIAPYPEQAQIVDRLSLRLKFSGVCGCIVSQLGEKASEEHAASTFRVEKSRAGKNTRM